MAAVVCAVSLAAWPLVAGASPITVTFDELPPQSFETIDVAGVTLGVDTRATFGVNGGYYGSFADLEGQALEGSTADTLTLDFDVLENREEVIGASGADGSPWPAARRRSTPARLPTPTPS